MGRITAHPLCFGVWHDPAHTDVDDDSWELYHLAEDFSESRDLATEHPDKLREMIERWWTEAGRYDALPLDPRPIWQLVRPQLRGGPTSRRQFVYHPPVAHLPVDVSPPHGPRPFEIVAEVELHDEHTDGALLNRGTINGGYALFVLNGRLVFDRHPNAPPGAGRRYGKLALTLLGANYVTLRAITWVGVPLLAAKVATDVTLFLVSYGIQRRYVFGTTDEVLVAPMTPPGRELVTAGSAPHTPTHLHRGVPS